MKLSRISKITCLLISSVVLTLIGATYGQSQHPILDQVANKVIQKYQTASCQQLWAEKSPKSASVTRGTKSSSVSEERPADARTVSQQSGSSDRQ